jgi:hypothetical protein
MPSRTRQLAYAFVGFIAGDAVLLLFMLLNAWWARSSLLAVHMGEPYRQIPNAIEMFALYAPFSVAGFLLVGIPVVLLARARSITHWPWPLVVVMGASLGPVALTVILLLLRAGVGGWALWLFLYSILVSAVGFTVYVALLRKQLRHDD